ncbi:MAG TPA: serine hydrolase domain-containing protein [Myxococcota bacterium]|nr:serine hydrolase domain-containing protein [Myxococcota bacterium]
MLDQRLLAKAPEDVGIDSKLLDAVFERAEKEVREGLLPSAQIAVARNGKLAGMRTFGRVQKGARTEPADDSTLYCVFSSTKAITSAAAWLAIQEGKLDVKRKVAELVPEFRENGKQDVVIEQLFTHTAGFPHAPFVPADFKDVDKRRARFAAWRLNWAPGSKFEYHPSSSMYVIADIVERLTGRPYGEFVRERIAKPLGLDDLWVGLPAALHGRVADCVHVGEALTEADYAKMGVPMPPVTEVTEDAITSFNRPEVRNAGIPGGGGTMTAAELALFYQALLDGGRALAGREIWQPETLAMARQVRSGELRDLLFKKLANRGLGVIVSGDADRSYRGFGHTNSELAFGHGGAGGQIAWADPKTGISIGYCTNGHDRNNVRQARRGVGISSRAAACLAAS